jgi:hypothetical protein
MGLRAIVTHDLTNLVVRQTLNQPRTHEQRKSKRRHGRQNGSQRQVRKDIEAGMPGNQVL